MNASKENCRKANEDLWKAAEAADVWISDPIGKDRLKKYLLKVQNFLEAAERKLPTEAAFARARDRKK